MTGKKNSTWAHALFGGLAVVYTWYLFRTLFLSPGTSFLVAHGDGSKNYFTYLFHVLFGRGWHYRGMNYPWGEHVSFTDNQPLLAVPLSYLQSVLHLNMNQALALMHLFIPLAFLCSLYFMYQLTRLLGIQSWLAVCCALLIPSMAPNLFRIFGHFGLSYSFHVTGFLWFYFSWLQTKKPKFLVFLFLIGICSGLLHLYNLAVLIFLSLFLTSASLLTAYRKRMHFGKLLLPFIATLMAFVVIKIIFGLSDPVSDRPTQPWGTLAYVSHLRDFFSSEISYLGRVFLPLIGEKNPAGLDEGYGYLGLAAGIYLIFIAGALLLQPLRKWIPVQTIQWHEHEKILLITALFGMVLCMGIPFVWGLDSLLEFTGPFRQFRSLGRFSIIPYFCLNMALVLRLQRIFQLWSFPLTGRQLLAPLTILFLWTIEVLSYSFKIQPQVDAAPSNYESFYAKEEWKFSPANIQTAQFQGIIGLPMYCIGSEKWGKEPLGGLPELLFKLSLQYQLPVVNKLLSRSSWEQEFQLMRLTNHPANEQTFFQASVNEKPFLLICPFDLQPDEGENFILNHCTELSRSSKYTILNFDWKQYSADRTHWMDSLQQTVLKEEKNFLHFNGYDSLNKENALFGQGGLSIQNKDSLLLLEGQFPFKPGEKYEISFWTRVNAVDYRNPYGRLFLTGKQQQILRTEEFTYRTSKSNIGFWLRLHTVFEADSQCSGLRLQMMNERGSAGDAIDNLLLRGMDDTVIIKRPDGILYNNYLIRLKRVSP